MATFSPSPAPRRSTRNKQRGNSPSQRTREASNLHTSRTPLPHDEIKKYHRDSSSMIIDVNDQGLSNPKPTIETIFAKSDELIVSFHANLPLEVKQVLKGADFYKDGYSGDIDTLTGFSVVTSLQTCYVWQHAQAIKGIPTCYIFSCPRDFNSRTPPLHALVPRDSSREPGLILISSSGDIRFWDSIGMGLAGGDHYSMSHLDIERGSQVNNLVRSDPQSFIVSTTNGRLFRLSLTSTSGKYHLTSRPFSRPHLQRTFSSMIPALFNSSKNTQLSPSVGYINSITLGPEELNGEREVWTSSAGWLHKWILKSDGWEELVMEQAITHLLEPEIRKSMGSQVDRETLQQSQDLDVELLDLAVDCNGHIIILISHAALEDEDEPSRIIEVARAVRRIYALAHLEIVGDKMARIFGVRTVPYQSTFTTGVDFHPRLQLLHEGALISVQFGTAVALCARDSGYCDRLELKNASTDRILGVGIQHPGDSLLILTAGLTMKANAELEQIKSFNFETGRTSLIKSIMMQAILYGSAPENPLQFSFPPELDEESLMKGAEQLSQAVLQSDPDLVRRNQDLSAQLTARKERLSWLIQFINTNAVLGKLSQRSRQKLATDAEKLYACHQLWLQYNELLASHPKHSILNDTVYAFMDEVGEGTHEDVVRTFFTMRVGDVGKMIRKLTDVVALISRKTGIDVSNFLPEASRIVVTVLRSAIDYRAHNHEVYGIAMPMIRPWTSKPTVIDVLLSLFEAFTKADDPMEVEKAVNNLTEEDSHLPELASTLFECIQERLAWLGSPFAANEPTFRRDKYELEQKFALLRPEVLETLRNHGQINAAFLLAEKYQDFASLVSLCHKGIVYPPQENPNAQRIQSYINRYKDTFTQELYQWYIQHGELRIMFNQQDTQEPLIAKFFTETPNDSISWLYNLSKREYGLATSAVMKGARTASNLEARHLMLSIGKLSTLAQTHETQVPKNGVLDTFHDELDFVSVHEALSDEFRSALEESRGRQPLESQIEIIIKKKAAALFSRTAFIHVFKDLLKQLLQGKALSVEDIVDLLTLKDNEAKLTDFATALELLTRAQDMPRARRLSAFRTVWRRVYIHDDWDVICKTANVPDEQVTERFLNTALYATFCATLGQDRRSEIPPDEALLVPTEEEIKSRWPGMSPDQVQSIVEDYDWERDRLGEFNLEGAFSRIRELAQHDLWSEQ